MKKRKIVAITFETKTQPKMGWLTIIKDVFDRLDLKDKERFNLVVKTARSSQLLYAGRASTTSGREFQNLPKTVRGGTAVQVTVEPFYDAFSKK